MQSEVYFMSFHHDGYLHKHSPGLGFCIRIFTIFAWSNSSIAVTNNLIIDNFIMTMMMNKRSTNNGKGR